MIYVVANSANEAWLSTFKSLYDTGKPIGKNRYLRDEVAVIEITNPCVELIDARFPMSQTAVNTITKYIVTGKDEGNVTHEWTKLYYHRAFDEPNSQVKFLLSKLDADYPVGETQISMWDKTRDQDSPISPCTQIIWARIKEGKLEVHTHAHSSDAYSKLLMNLLEFIALQQYLADQVGLPVGKYYHFLDSCHLHFKDANAIKILRQQIEKEETNSYARSS